MLAAALAAAALTGNLLANPGAEAGPGSPDSTAINPPPGWTAEGQFTAVRYGAPTFLTTTDGMTFGGGANFFAGGNTGPSAGSQTIDVSSAAAEIDAGGVTATLSGLLGGYDGQEDRATLSAAFLNAAGAFAGPGLVAPSVTMGDRNAVSTLLARSATGRVPAGTRRIVVRLDLERVSGSYNDGYADNLSLTLSGAAGEAPPPVFHKTVTAGRVSGKIRFRAPGSRTFVTLIDDQSLPLGSVLDTKHGVMELTSVPRAGGTPQTVRFFDGLFKVTQPGRITQLALTEKLAPCRRASAAAKKPKTRRLWGEGQGSFRISGRYSAATVRGTRWLVQDTCAGTLTRVTQGAVSVRDNVRHKTIVVRAGHRYLAKPRR
jgi:hypothetical protein